jgi:hypothetical protein
MESGIAQLAINVSCILLAGRSVLGIVLVVIFDAV